MTSVAAIIMIDILEKLTPKMIKKHENDHVLTNSNEYFGNFPVLFFSYSYS